MNDKEEHSIIFYIFMIIGIIGVIMKLLGKY